MNTDSAILLLLADLRARIAELEAEIGSLRQAPDPGPQPDQAAHRA